MHHGREIPGSGAVTQELDKGKGTQWRSWMYELELSNSKLGSQRAAWGRAPVSPGSKGWEGGGGGAHDDEDEGTGDEGWGTGQTPGKG